MKKYIISSSIVLVLISIVAFRLASNKSSFNKELKMVSESNTIIPVIIDTVKQVQNSSEISVNGTFYPAHEISITAEIQGKITSIRSQVGDKVVKGQILATIDNKILASQLRLAKFNLDKAEKDMKRYEQLSQTDAATIQQYEEAKQNFETTQSAYVSAKVENENAFIKAPFNGIITKRWVDQGSYVSPGVTVFDLVEMDKLKFIAKVTATEAEKIQKNQLVTFCVNDFPGTNYEGKVRAVIVKADLSKRYDVEVEVNNNSDKQIKPGMYGTALFENHSDITQLVIPRKAIAGSIQNPEIYRVNGDRVHLQKIVVTPLNDHDLAVNEGLELGDIIVTSGQINLVDGSKIKRNN